MAVFFRRYSTLIFLLFLSCTSEEVQEPDFIESTNVQTLESELLASVNNYRVSIGEGILELNAIAYDVANDHNDYMISKGSLSHDNFEQRASKIHAETSAKEIAENVGRNFQTAEEALQWWLNSPTHKSSLEGNFTHTGISVKKDNLGNIYYTQIFFK
ncbi:CAP domain-containing protein [Allomuricauda sp. SCSIO 65647]|uniref:CAP domain-containing protein n=1 Tax=Allomuricauda sp. SCSIO 65647 TaxID=2908843 RepID=UPI001F1B0F96|nr:CAP domain-containing protein [Muricauda sp. SCSIO 65647]UJH66037.1 CAP domain-containing protein [Muricauda sp. SCSIO 65647]